MQHKEFQLRYLIALSNICPKCNLNPFRNENAINLADTTIMTKPAKNSIVQYTDSIYHDIEIKYDI